MGTSYVSTFLQYLKYEKRYSPLTSLAYEKNLRDFFAYLLTTYAIEDIKQIKHLHIRSWLASLKEAKQTATTINRKQSVLRSFFKYAQTQNWILTNPISTLRSLRTPERIPIFLKDEETEFLFEELSFGEGFKGFTDRLILELLYQTGMRRAELLALKEQQIEWSLHHVRVIGKGNKERLIPISKHLESQMQAYINEKKRLFENPNTTFFILENGQNLYAGYVYRLVKKHLSATTSLKKKSPHVMRHTFATQLLNNGANLQAIKDLLGHSSLASTQIYTHNHISKLKDIHKKNHPRG
ncbi:MAG: tyrosine-type recombinase/integrase [Bacteroidota bacterium]|jgi:integrase/recombinase XerC|nr:tyrosine-type recombinase/integrase [Bacteroidota bacterium]